MGCFSTRPWLNKSEWRSIPPSLFVWFHNLFTGFVVFAGCWQVLQGLSGGYDIDLLNLKKKQRTFYWAILRLVFAQCIPKQDLIKCYGYQRDGHLSLCQPAGNTSQSFLSVECPKNNIMKRIPRLKLLPTYSTCSIKGWQRKRTLLSDFKSNLPLLVPFPNHVPIISHFISRRRSQTVSTVGP